MSNINMKLVITRFDWKNPIDNKHEAQNYKSFEKDLTKESLRLRT